MCGGTSTASPFGCSLLSNGKCANIAALSVSAWSRNPLAEQERHNALLSRADMFYLFDEYNFFVGVAVYSIVVQRIATVELKFYSIYQI